MAWQRRLTFPRGFLWGTASAAYQNEGNSTNNQWYSWQQQGHILTGERVGNAADWWERAEEDFERAEQMENNALRLSLEWSRIEPSEGYWDSAALDRYRAMLIDLRHRNMKPVVTLHHFTDPLWFADRDGFVKEENIRYFVRYVTYVVEALKDLCDFWVTLNEPNMYAALGYLIGSFPPGENNILRAMHVLRNMMKAHVEAFYAIRRVQPASQIGYCLHYRLFDPANPVSALDCAVTKVHDTFFNWAALRAAETGRIAFPLNFQLAPIPHARGSRDYHGVNYYTREMVRFDPFNPREVFGRRFTRPDAVRNDPGADNNFGEIYPEGLYRVLKTIYRRTKGNKPMYITENGFTDALDNRRPAAVLEHLAVVHRAIQDGMPVRGYFHWTLVDSFEWADGWGVRLGLIELNQVTQERIPRPSASMFGEICRANAITESIVERYAPKSMDAIFGPTKEVQRQIPV